MSRTPATSPAPSHPWVGHAWITPSGAVVAEAAAGLDPVTVFRHAARLSAAVFFDSAAVDRPTAPPPAGEAATIRLGRHSFVAADPIHSWRLDRGADWAASRDAIAATWLAIRRMLSDLACTTIPGLPPFQGGLAGLVSYEVGLTHLGLEPPPAAGPDPLLSLHVYDVVYAHDHDLGRGWFISQGVPARGPVARARRARDRLAAFLAEPAVTTGPTVAAVAAAAAHPLPGRPGVRSTHTRDAYLAMIEAGVDFVRAGDIFQANLAQRFEVAADVDPVALYLRAREINPAPFAGYLDAGGVQVASMSPERFLEVARGVVRTHPIKGTRRVTASPEADLWASAELEASDKDRAENVMIVDLCRASAESTPSRRRFRAAASRGPPSTGPARSSRCWSRSPVAATAARSAMSASTVRPTSISSSARS